MILLDQLKSEHTIDIFQTVREFQRQRPELIKSFVILSNIHFLIQHFRFLI